MAGLPLAQAGLEHVCVSVKQVLLSEKKKKKYFSPFYLPEKAKDPTRFTHTTDGKL